MCDQHTSVHHDHSQTRSEIYARSGRYDTCHSHLHTVDDYSGAWLDQYPGLIFPQDNARPHTTSVAMSCFTACQTLPWPARSPDFSPIEHLWKRIGRRMHLRGNMDDRPGPTIGAKFD
ncbi:transposable element Tc1 transposase [Trichonephila clavipes]|nr:transposable element Tc1 transposase [Trichonephila clavipes]